MGRELIWNVQHRRNPNFTGREDILIDLRNKLLSGESIALTQAIVGLGGVGKTQTVLEYTHRYADNYRHIWWVRAEDPSSLMDDYISFARRLKLISEDISNGEEILQKVLYWLEVNTDWLLILDNVSEPPNIFKFLPPRASGHIIITTRNSNWRGRVKTLSIKVFEQEEAVSFLQKRLGDTDVSGLIKLAEVLGSLPLALEQAAAYIEQTNVSVKEYLMLYDKYRGQLLEQRKPFIDYPETVATTWEISFKQVQVLSSVGEKILNLCAFMAPDNIPLSLLKTILTEHMPQLLDGENINPLNFYDGIGVLRSYSLIEATEVVSIHRLVQAVVRDRLDKNANTWCEIAIVIIYKVFIFDSNDMQTWPESLSLLPHVIEIVNHSEKLNVALEEKLHLLAKIGSYFENIANLIQARDYFERALAIGKKLYGIEHPNVAISLSNLGSVLKTLGDLEGAKQYIKQALAIAKKVYGPEHPSVAISLSNLGLVLKASGDLEEAKNCIEQSLAIMENIYGHEHPNVATLLNNLSVVLKNSDDLVGAKQCIERALAIAEKVYGTEHPDVAKCLSNLGTVLQALGDIEGAKQYIERALNIDKKIYGLEHPELAIDLNNLGSVLHDLRDMEGAKQCFEQAFSIEKHQK